VKNWRLLLYTILGILIIGEYLIYFIVAMSWNVPTKKSKHDLKVLFVSDPQIQVNLLCHQTHRIIRRRCVVLFCFYTKF
jgi:flagellar basal body-associated protein FliL